MDQFSLAKGPPSRPAKEWPDDDEALIEFGDGQKKLSENYWSLNDAFQGVQVFGGTGSGKSSGSGQAIARAFLAGNLGGLVLTAKTDEVFAWQEYARQTGRSEDLIIVDEQAKWRFNFLRYELKVPVPGQDTPKSSSTFSVPFWKRRNAATDRRAEATRTGSGR